MSMTNPLVNPTPSNDAQDMVSLACDAPDQNGAPSEALSRVASNREFHYELGRRFAEWQRRRLPVSLVKLSLDGFTSLEVGSSPAQSVEVYRAVTLILVTTIRKMDLLTCCEEGEFSILLPDTSIAGAKHATERIRRAFAIEHELQREFGLTLTVSIGVACVGPDDNESSLAERASEALTESKARGGNCIRFHDGDDIVEELDAQIAFDRQFAHARRMETVGRLAAGVAHEINTPVQYVGGNVSFLEEAFNDICSLLDAYEQLLTTVESGRPTDHALQAVQQRAASIDLELLREEIPKAISQSLDGVQRVSQIVRSMKEFAHPESRSKTPSDLNRIIKSMVTVSASEWKHAADLVTELDPDLPHVAVLPGEFGQVIVNLLVNAAQAISEFNGRSGDKGMITVSTRFEQEQVVIRIHDTGPGIPEENRSRIYDHFFTTKPVGVGSGQGLAMAHAMIVNELGGTIDFENDPVQGTTFIICLPVDAQMDPKEAVQHEATHSLYRR